MNNIKDRLQFIIGFAAITISLSAFKNELKSFVLDFQFVSFSLSDYLFAMIIGFIIVIHLYVVPYIFSTTIYSNKKIFQHLESLSYFLFVAIILSPSLLLIIYLIQLSLLPVSALGNKTSQSVIMTIVSGIMGLIGGKLSKYVVNKFQSTKKHNEETDLQEEEVKSFEITQKLIEKGFYNQAILESFKILEIHLYKVLRVRDLVFRRGDFFEMINLAKKDKIFSGEQIKNINNIRILKNEIAHHIDFSTTKKEAEEVLKIVKEILLSSEDVKNKYCDSINKYFTGKVMESLPRAKEVSLKQNKPIFIVIYDKTHPKQSKLDYSLRYFMEYNTTKKLVSDNFIQVLIDSTSAGAKELISGEDLLENCLLVIVTPKGEFIRRENVYANPDEGMKRVKESVAKWQEITSS